MMVMAKAESQNWKEPVSVLLISIHCAGRLLHSDVTVIYFLSEGSLKSQFTKRRTSQRFVQLYDLSQCHIVLAACFFYSLEAS